MGAAYGEVMLMRLAPDSTQVAARGTPNGGLGSIATGALIVAGLYLGRDVFVPVALAILFSFVLAPLVKGLQKLRIPRSLAVIIVVLVAFAGLASLTMAMVTQATQLAGQLPSYQSTMRAKIASLKGSGPGRGALTRAADVLQDLGKELDRPKAEAASPSDLPAPTTDRQPIPVAADPSPHHDRHRLDLRDLHSAET